MSVRQAARGTTAQGSRAGVAAGPMLAMGFLAQPCGIELPLYTAHNQRGKLQAHRPPVLGGKRGAYARNCRSVHGRGFAGDGQGPSRCAREQSGNTARHRQYAGRLTPTPCRAQAARPRAAFLLAGATASIEAVPLALDILPHLEAQARERMLAGVAPNPPADRREGCADKGEAIEQACKVTGAKPPSASSTLATRSAVLRWCSERPA